VIDSWRGTEALAAAAALGYDGILSNGYYIDLMYPASDHYMSDPIPASPTLTAAQRAHILGGEATMWSEWVTPETIDSRIWPRTAAIAERLWSPAGVRDIPDMYRRMAIVGARLDEAGSLHERNRDLMLRHLVGENLDVPGIASLRTFVELIEPVKHYRRGQLQPWANQLIPLVGIADAARADSAPSREFAGSVDRLLFEKGGIDRAQAGPLADRLGAWGAAGTEVAGPLVDVYPALREATPTARDLADACAVGRGALQSLASGTPIDAAGLKSALAALDRAGEPNGSATELPVLAPIRLLVVAAAMQGERAGLSDGAWRAQVTSAAFPPAPADATH
jgi:hexosaminidase